MKHYKCERNLEVQSKGHIENRRPMEIDINVKQYVEDTSIWVGVNVELE
jgi:hypothetical protein